MYSVTAHIKSHGKPWLNARMDFWQDKAFSGQKVTHNTPMVRWGVTQLGVLFVLSIHFVKHNTRKASGCFKDFLYKKLEILYKPFVSWNF